MDYRDFGRTGHASSRVIFGAAALGRMRQERADEILGTLLEFGVNHIDTAAGYGDSELRIAPWMPEHRQRFFVATKTNERTGAGARAGLEQSLSRLGVDHVDLRRVVPRRLRARRVGVPRAQHRRADHQVAGPAAVGRPVRAPFQLVPAPGGR